MSCKQDLQFIKECLYTFFMPEGTPICNNLDEFNSIIIDFAGLEVKIEDKDKVILSIMSLVDYDKYFK